MNKKQLATYGITKKNFIQRVLCKLKTNHEDKKQIQRTMFDENGHAVNKYSHYCKRCGQRI